MHLIQNLPGLASSGIKVRFLSEEEKTIKTDEQELPLVIETVTEKSFRALAALVKQHCNWFNQQLVQYGAILFRGFEVESAEQFQTVLELLGVELASHYHFGSAARHRITDKVFLSSSAPPSIIISPHNELNFVPIRPGIIAFFCQIQADLYGETPLINTEKLFYDLSPGLQAKFTNFSQQFVRYIPQHLLEVVFEDISRDEITKLLQAQGFDFNWHEDDSLSLKHSYTPLFRHPLTDRLCFCLSIFDCLINREWYIQIKERYPLMQGLYHSLLPVGLYKKFEQYRPTVTNIFDSNKLKGSISMSFIDPENEPIKITAAEAQELGKAECKNAAIFKWQQGDVLIVDNRSVAHSRLNTKSPRKVLTAFGNMYDVRDMKPVVSTSNR